jgi:hypothetical protein
LTLLALGQRKREKLAALEAKAKTVSSQASTQPQNLSNSAATTSLQTPSSTQCEPQNERLDAENTPMQTPAPELEVSKEGFNVDLFGSLYSDEDSILLGFDQYTTCQVGEIELNPYDAAYSEDGIFNSPNSLRCTGLESVRSNNNSWIPRNQPGKSRSPSCNST